MGVEYCSWCLFRLYVLYTLSFCHYGNASEGGLRCCLFQPGCCGVAALGGGGILISSFSFLFFSLFRRRGGWASLFAVLVHQLTSGTARYSARAGDPLYQSTYYPVWRISWVPCCPVWYSTVLTFGVFIGAHSVIVPSLLFFGFNSFFRGGNMWLFDTLVYAWKRHSAYDNTVPLALPRFTKKKSYTYKAINTERGEQPPKVKETIFFYFFFYLHFYIFSYFFLSQPPLPFASATRRSPTFKV